MTSQPSPSPDAYDIAVIGGGVNGCGIARDAAGRGLSVALFEQGDLASATSQWSTKLIHGGLRYLEHYEFRLVREALAERETLLAMAPHIIWPLRFVLPHHEGLRPAWLLRLGLFLYDRLGGRSRLPGTRRLDLRSDPAGRPLRPGFRTGFEYSDCWVQDARLVVLNAMDAASRGAAVHVGTRVTSARREGGLWHVEAQGPRGPVTVRARTLVNAAGPWVAAIFDDVLHAAPPARVRLVKGSHIVVRRLYEHDRCYIFQNADGRIVFAIPYERDFTLIGTTDSDYAGDPAAVAASDDEVRYLCAAASEYFARPVAPDDVVWRYAGVRPLYDDGASKAQEATRDYVLALDEPAGQPPLLSVFGGKITTYRRLAEAALGKLGPWLGERKPWTAGATLPGGDFPADGRAALAADILARHPWLPRPTAERFARTYGTLAFALLEGCAGASDLGRDYGTGLSDRELGWLYEREFARTGADVLWRRGKLGLHLSPAAAEAVDNRMRELSAGDAVKASAGHAASSV